VWEFNRNDQLTQTYDAIKGTSITSPRLNRNQFGANVGGPIWLPKIYNGKDKTSSSSNWESGYAALGATPQYYIVPTQAQRNGDFRGLTDNAGKPITLKDPLGIGIANNVVPAAQLSKQTQAFLQFEPLPNTRTASSISRRLRRARCRPTQLSLRESTIACRAKTISRPLRIQRYV